MKKKVSTIIPPQRLEKRKNGIYPVWDPSITYSENDKVEWKGFIYEAKFWSQNQEPEVYHGEELYYKAWRLIRAVK